MKVARAVVRDRSPRGRAVRTLTLLAALLFSGCQRSPVLPAEGSYVTQRLGGADPDRDGVIDIADNCPLEDNADQANGDGDELGDVCDPCPATVLNVEGCPSDSDSDRTPDRSDRCPLDPLDACAAAGTPAPPK